jgi:uroporphyrinogen decarboxylase
MNKRERVIAAIKHERPDKVPWMVNLSGAARNMVAEYYGNETLKDPLSLWEWLGNHMRIVTPWLIGFHELEEEVRPGIWRDKFGIIWDTRGLYGEGEWGRPINTQLSEPSLAGYSFPEPPGPEDFAHYPKFIEEHREHFLIAVVGSLFEPAWALRGMENLLIDMSLNPGFVEDLLDTIVEHYLKIIDQAVQYDIDACHFGDDWGSERAPLMGPRFWRKYIKPRMAKMFARVKEGGKSVFLHSDGNLSLIFEDLIEIGLDVYNPLQPEIVDVFEVKRKHGDRLCFWGGIGLRSLISGTPQTVREDVGRLISEVGADGGLILAQAHPDGILGDVPVENIVAALETVTGQ